VKNGGIEVVNVDWVLDDVVGVVVSFSLVEAFLKASTGHLGSEAYTMVVAAVIVLSQLALAVNGASKFSAKDDHGILKHSTFLKIFDQGCSRLIDALAVVSKVLW